MYEHNYCQHKALKPADFKLNSAALQGPASSGRQEGPGDVDTWAGMVNSVHSLQ